MCGIMQTAWLSKAVVFLGLLNNMNLTCIFKCEDIRFQLFNRVLKFALRHNDIAKFRKPHLCEEFKKS